MRGGYKSSGARIYGSRHAHAAGGAISSDDGGDHLNMKSLFSRTHFLIILALLVAPCDAALGQGGPPAPGRGGSVAWQEFTSEAGAFRVKFPGKPRPSQVPFQRGPVSFVRYVHQSSLDAYNLFELDYVDMPAGYDDPDLTTEGGIAGLTRAMLAQGGRVLSKSDVASGSCAGRETTINVPQAGKMAFAHARVFNSGQRYYFLLYMGEDKGERTRQLARTFMESFSVTGGCTKAVAATVAPSAEKTTGVVEGVPDASTGWRRIESAEHGFSVLMPGRAGRESEQAQVQPFLLWHHTYTHDGEEVLYSAEVIGDYPDNFHSGKAASKEAVLDLTLYALKRNLEPFGFTLTHARDLRMGQFPGREYSLANAKLKLPGRAQLFVTPKRLYIFIALNRGQTPSTKDLERFFTSIRISPTR